MKKRNRLITKDESALYMLDVILEKERLLEQEPVLKIEPTRESWRLNS